MSTKPASVKESRSGSRTLDLRPEMHARGDDGKTAKRLEDTKPQRTPGGRRIQHTELPVFTRAMSAMLSAGLPVVQCMQAMEEQVESRAFRSVLRRVRLAVQYGNRLSDSMALFPDVFDTMFVSMLRTGEVSGRLTETLESLADHIEAGADLRRKVQAALMYPIAVASIALLLMTAMMLWIVPAFEQIYSDLGGDLPAATLILIRISRALREHFLPIAGGFAAILVGTHYWKKTASGRYSWDRFVLSVPVFGGLMQKVALAQFAETMGQMLHNGIPILRALDLVGGVVGNEVLRRVLVNARTSVEQGKTLSVSLKDGRWYPPLLIQMVATGERTGKMDEMLNRIGKFYRDEVSVILKGMTSLIEPILIVFLGTLVGGMVVCMFIPIFRLHELVKF